MKHTHVSRTYVVILLSIFLIAVASGLPIIKTNAGDTGLIPPLSKSGIPNPFLNIGPGLPAVVKPGDSFTVILKDVKKGDIVSATLIKVKLEGGRLVKVEAQAKIYKINNTAYNITIPQNLEDGLYDLIVKYASGSTDVSTRSIWVLSSLNDLGDIIRFMHISDLHFGAGTPSPTIGQYRRFTGLLFSQLSGTDVILDTGDEADTQATAQYINSLAYRYAFAYPIPEILNPGNHDYPNNNFVKYYEQTHGYVVLGGKILVIFINTDGENGYPSWSDMVFLRDTLQKYKNIPYKFVMMHHPVFYYQGSVTTSSDANTTLLGNPHKYSKSVLSYYWGGNLTATRYFLKLCEDYNVTLVLAGHIHRDQYVIYHSTRTGTITHFQTTTTLAHGTGTYQGLQIFDFNPINGNWTYPLAPPWFIGYQNGSRNKVFNSIPITMPQYTDHWQKQFDDTYFYGEIHENMRAIILELWNNLPYFNANKTVLIALPWPENYKVNLKIVNSTNGAAASLVDQLKVSELNRTFIALHLKLPSKSSIVLALYTVEDTQPPSIQLRTILPKNPTINRTVKAYIEITDTGWGVESVKAKATASNGEIKGFKLEKYGENTYLATFKVIGKSSSTLQLTVKAIDYSGHTTEKTFTINLSGPATTQETTTSTTTTTTGAGKGTKGNTGTIIAAIIIIIIIIAIIALAVRR